MSFFDKFKTGVAEAGNKAKMVVEVNRLKMQNSSKQNEVNEQYQAIGKLVYAAAEQGSWPLPLEEFAAPIERIIQLRMEIEQNLLQIANLSDMKVCRSCGSSVPVNVRFCSSCGSTFEISVDPIPVEESGEDNNGETNAGLLPEAKSEEETS